MKRFVDCLLIGHNEMDFELYEKTVRMMGTDSGAFRDLGKSVLYFDGKPYSIADAINLVSADQIARGVVNPFNMLEPHSNSIGYLGTYLHRRGKTFEYVNSFQDEKPRLETLLKEYDILSIGIIT